MKLFDQAEYRTLKTFFSPASRPNLDIFHFRSGIQAILGICYRELAIREAFSCPSSKGMRDVCFDAVSCHELSNTRPMKDRQTFSSHIVVLEYLREGLRYHSYCKIADDWQFDDPHKNRREGVSSRKYLLGSKKFGMFSNERSGIVFVGWLGKLRKRMERPLRLYMENRTMSGSNR